MGGYYYGEYQTHCNGTCNFPHLNKRTLSKFSKHIDSTQFKSYKLLQQAYSA